MTTILVCRFCKISAAQISNQPFHFEQNHMSVFCLVLDHVNEMIEEGLSETWDEIVHGRQEKTNQMDFLLDFETVRGAFNHL